MTGEIEYQKTREGWSETDDGKEWDEFVARYKGSIFHLWSWRKVLEGTYSKPYYLAYRDADGTVLAVCPFFYRSGRFATYLDSLPESHTAGPIISERIANLSQVLSVLAKSTRFSLLSPVVAMRIRTSERKIIEHFEKLGFGYNMTHLFTLDLQKTPPVHIWNSGFNKHDRQAVKYYENGTSVFTFARSQDDYSRYLSLERGFVKPERERELFLERLRTHMGDRLSIPLLIHDSQVVAGMLALCNKANSTVSLMMIAFARLGKNIHSPVTYLDWKVINWAHEQGFRYVDFGSYSIAAIKNPLSHPYRLKARFETSEVPRCQFVIPTSAITYSILRRINRIL